MAPRTVILKDGDVEYRVTIHDGGRVSVDDRGPLEVQVEEDGELRIGSAPSRIAWAAASGDTRWVFVDGQIFELELQSGSRRRTRAAHGSLSAPMPASVVRVDVSPGDAIRRGDTLIILEAMKMELPVRAPADGVVQAVHCKAGDLVQPGVVLIDIV
jgi:biotin carboxyl carrier protein